MPLSLDSEWVRINDEFDTDGNRTVPVFARMVRTYGGMVMGRIVRGNTSDRVKFEAQKYRFGNFIAVSDHFDIVEAFRALEAAI